MLRTSVFGKRAAPARLLQQLITEEIALLLRDGDAVAVDDGPVSYTHLGLLLFARFGESAEITLRSPQQPSSLLPS